MPIKCSERGMCHEAAEPAPDWFLIITILPLCLTVCCVNFILERRHEYCQENYNISNSSFDNLDGILKPLNFFYQLTLTEYEKLEAISLAMCIIFLLTNGLLSVWIYQNAVPADYLCQEQWYILSNRWANHLHQNRAEFTGLQLYSNKSGGVL